MVETRVVCRWVLFSIVFLQKFALPLGGALQLQILVPICVLALIYLLLTNQAEIDPLNLSLLALFLGMVVLASVLAGRAFSATSVLLLITLYTFWSLRLPIAYADYLDILRFFQRCMFVLVAFEAVQYLTQLVGLPMPLLDSSIFPDAFLVHNFNYVQGILWNSTIMKPNGFFMLETSFLAQFLGFALAIEVLVFKRNAATALLVVALLLTLGGTGMMLAALLLPVVLKPRNIGMLLIAATIIILFLRATDLLDILIGRIGEFSDPNASGNGRFVLPYIRMYETVANDDLWRFLVGIGAGNMNPGIGFAYAPTARVWVEFGLPTFLVFFAFTLTVFLRNPLYPLLTIIFICEYFVVAGDCLLQPSILYGCFFLGAGYRITTPERNWQGSSIDRHVAAT
jgi:hypothetical protein